MDVLNLINNIEEELITEFKVEISKGIKADDLAYALTDILIDYYLGKSLN